MPKLLTDAATLMCPHGGSVSIVTSNARVKAGGGFVVRGSDTFLIAGCALNVAGALHPCLSVRWVQTALHNKVIGNAALNEQSIGLCVAGDQAVQGTVQIVNTQQKAAGL